MPGKSRCGRFAEGVVGERWGSSGKKRNLPPWPGRFLLVSGPKLEPRPKTVGGCLSRPAIVPRAGLKSDYFFFVDFLVVFLPDFFELAFFVAMALTSFLVRQIYGPQKNESTFFFSGILFFQTARAAGAGSD